MQVTRKVLLLGTAIVLAMLVALAVGLSASWQMAIRNAKAGCDGGLGIQPGHLPVEPSVVTSVQLTVLGSADHSHRWSLLDAYQPVWVIGMEGKFPLTGGPPAIPPNPNPTYWYACRSIVDALTGQVRSLPVE